MKKRIPVDIQFLLESILDEAPNMLNIRSRKSLLKENPDKVDLKGGSGGDMKIARYHDNDAVAFFAFPNFAAYYEERAAIADKLGMTVAEFNSIMNVNENEL